MLEKNQTIELRIEIKYELVGPTFRTAMAIGTR
jgi:hypothetical protein